MKRAFLSLAMVAMLTTACTPDGELNEDYNGNQTEQPGGNNSNEDETPTEQPGGNNGEQGGNPDEGGNGDTTIPDVNPDEGGEGEDGGDNNPDQGNTPEDGGEGDNPDQGGEGGDNPSEGEQGGDGNNDGEGNGDGEGGSDGNEDETPTEQPSEVIEFQDENTKLICTLHWDENEDGELSYEEAAAVTDLGTAFKNSTILAFDELKYFTGITKIRDYAFYNCTELESVTIPNSVTKIGVYAFYNCSSLESITIPESVTSIGSNAFYGCRSLTSITIPDSVTSIGDKVFRNCTSITSVTIPNSITEIGESAFYGCTGELLIDSKIIATNYNRDNYPKSSSSAWLYGYNFTKLTIGDNITSIGNYTFYNCRSLTSVTIPDCVTKIGVSAFQDCTSLTSAYCKPITPPDWGSNMFENNASGFKIYVPRNAVDAYKRSWRLYYEDGYIEGYDF